MDSIWNGIQSIWNRIQSIWNRIQSIWNRIQSIWNGIQSTWNGIHSMVIPYGIEDLVEFGNYKKISSFILQTPLTTEMVEGQGCENKIMLIYSNTIYII